MKRKVTDEQILEALQKHRGIRSAASRDLDISTRQLMTRISGLMGRGVEIPASTYTAQPSGTSTLYGPDGSVRLQWVKEKADEDQNEARLQAAAEALAQVLPRAKPTPLPKNTAASLCTVYTLTDCHVGMLAWGRETGADWDLAIAEQTLTGCFLQSIESALPSRVGIVNQLGDFLHFDSLVPETPTNRHVLDADSRYPKVVEAAVRILRRIIDAAVAKHDQVVVYMHEGNHDPAASVWLRTMFAALYEDEPRITVDTSPSPYVAYAHGETMIGFHHGHLSKNQSLPLLFAAKFPDVWGATRSRYIHVGHRHHVEEKEHPGVNVIQHPTLAAPDAYASRGGWLSRRQASAITYHAKYGEFARHVIVPEMAA